MKRALWINLFAMTAIACSGCATGARLSPTQLQHSALIGTWKGQATPVVAWVRADRISIELTIRPDGTVAGHVGDAQISESHIIAGRGNVRASMGWGRDYIVQANLAGPIIESERIHRDAINIIFDHHGSELQGGFHTSGSKFGGRDDMRLSAGSMVLRRQP